MTYGALQRLISAETTQPERGQSFSYANGNLTAMPMLTLGYDIENRLVEASHSLNGTDKYAYDPSNRRVWKQKPELCPGCPPPEEVYFYGVDGTRLGTYVCGSYCAAVCTSTNVYFAGKLIWQEYSNGAPAGPAITDRLGSVVSNWQGQKYYPYGEEYTTTHQDRTKFATYYRDYTRALDYANQVTHWNSSSMVSQAQTLIHELGHVFNILLGAGGSNFVYDSLPNGDPDPVAQAKNSRIMQDCIRDQP